MEKKQRVWVDTPARKKWRSRSWAIFMIAGWQNALLRIQMWRNSPGFLFDFSKEEEEEFRKLSAILMQDMLKLREFFKKKD